jgi:hypothetical protein
MSTAARQARRSATHSRTSRQVSASAPPETRLTGRLVRRLCPDLERGCRRVGARSRRVRSTSCTSAVVALWELRPVNARPHPPSPSGSAWSFSQTSPSRTSSPSMQKLMSSMGWLRCCHPVRTDPRSVSSAARARAPSPRTRSLSAASRLPSSRSHDHRYCPQHQVGQRQQGGQRHRLRVHDGLRGPRSGRNTMRLSRSTRAGPLGTRSGVRMPVGPAAWSSPQGGPPLHRTLTSFTGSTTPAHHAVRRSATWAREPGPAGTRPPAPPGHAPAQVDSPRCRYGTHAYGA